MVSEAINFSGKHILIIDDKSPFVYSVAGALKKEGCHVSVTDVENLREKILHGDIIDLILVDEQMPKAELEGLILATRQTVISTPVVVMSSWGDVEYVGDLLEKGTVEFIDKQAVPSILLRQILMILHQYDIKHVRE
jgi:DNA-binding NtrC family response regulator